MLGVKRGQTRSTLKYVQRTTLNYIKNEFGKTQRHERAKKKQVPFFKTKHMMGAFSRTDHLEENIWLSGRPTVQSRKAQLTQAGEP